MHEISTPIQKKLGHCVKSKSKCSAMTCKPCKLIFYHVKKRWNRANIKVGGTKKSGQAFF